MTRKKIDTASLFSEDTDAPEKKSIAKPAVAALVNPEDKTVHRVQALELHIDPSVIRPWSLHDRDDSKLNETDCADIIESIKAIEQKDPIKVRPLVNDPDGYQYEIIKGRRRTFACSVLGKKVLARAEEMDDRAAWLEMDSENDDRQDISEMERAKSYVVALNAGLFESGAQLAQLRGKNRSHVSRFVKAASVLEFEPFMNMVNDWTEIPVMPAYKLAQSMDNDPQGKYKKWVLNQLQYMKDSGVSFEPKQVLAKLNKENPKSLSAGKAAPETKDRHEVLKGDVLVMDAKKVKGGVISVNADVEKATAAELKKAFAETLKKMGVK